MLQDFRGEILLFTIRDFKNSKDMTMKAMSQVLLGENLSFKISSASTELESKLAMTLKESLLDYRFSKSIGQQIVGIAMEIDPMNADHRSELYDSFRAALNFSTFSGRIKSAQLLFEGTNGARIKFVVKYDGFKATVDKFVGNEKVISNATARTEKSTTPISQRFEPYLDIPHSAKLLEVQVDFATEIEI